MRSKPLLEEHDMVDGGDGGWDSLSQVRGIRAGCLVDDIAMRLAGADATRILEAVDDDGMAAWASAAEDRATAAHRRYWGPVQPHRVPGLGDELAAQVGQRAKSLAVVNDELRQEIAEHRRAAAALRQEIGDLQRRAAELAHFGRLTTLGVLAASIVHEVRQPLSGIVTNAGTCLLMLADASPDLDKVRETTKRTLRDCHRASEVVARLRALFAGRGVTAAKVDINEVVQEAITLMSSELLGHRVHVRSELADDLPPVTGDCVQLQQVVLNLILNAADAMSGVEGRPRQMVITTGRDEGDRVRLAVRDSGIGIPAESAESLLEAFYTTKRDGMGIGLSVSRTIIESHGGVLSAMPNDGPGATFWFSVPCFGRTVTLPE
jgi:C4-dicarboxylate-specific signal transduction histidine kinase